MSFHKRWLSREKIIKRFDERGLLGVQEYIGKSDALICEDSLSSDIVNVLLDEKLNLPEKWAEISELILKERNERERTVI